MACSFLCFVLSHQPYQQVTLPPHLCWFCVRKCDLVLQNHFCKSWNKSAVLDRSVWKGFVVGCLVWGSELAPNTCCPPMSITMIQLFTHAFLTLNTPSVSSGSFSHATSLGYAATAHRTAGCQDVVMTCTLKATPALLLDAAALMGWLLFQFRDAVQPLYCFLLLHPVV